MESLLANLWENKILYCVLGKIKFLKALKTVECVESTGNEQTRHSYVGTYMCISIMDS